MCTFAVDVSVGGWVGVPEHGWIELGSFGGRGVVGYTSGSSPTKLICVRWRGFALGSEVTYNSQTALSAVFFVRD